MGLVSTSEGSTTQLMATRDGITIQQSFSNKSKTIKGFSGDGNELDDVSIVDANKMAKCKDLIKVRVSFLTPGARLVFTKLRQAFIKALILHHFDSKYYICVKTNILKYTIGEILSQLTLDNLNKWHLMVFVVKK